MYTKKKLLLTIALVGFIVYEIAKLSLYGMIYIPFGEDLSRVMMWAGLLVAVAAANIVVVLIKKSQATCKIEKTKLRIM